MALLCYVGSSAGIWTFVIWLGQISSSFSWCLCAGSPALYFNISTEIEPYNKCAGFLALAYTKSQTL